MIRERVRETGGEKTQRIQKEKGRRESNKSALWVIVITDININSSKILMDAFV